MTWSARGDGSRGSGDGQTDHESEAPIIFEDVELLRETEKAWRVEIDGETLWLPKSQAWWVADGRLAMMAWLARERNLA